MSKRIYPSKYTSEKVTAQQFLCDEIMERIAKKEGGTLPYKYWNSPQWKKQYLRQVTAAGKLLREVDCTAIMTYLRSPKGRNIFSLGLKKEIIEGASKLSILKNSVNVETILCDDFIPDLDIEEIKTDEMKPSLWEKL